MALRGRFAPQSAGPDTGKSTLTVSRSAIIEVEVSSYVSFERLCAMNPASFLVQFSAESTLSVYAVEE